MISKLPKISIVTPSFNQGQFIEDAIRSVIAQNYDNFEHIIIDACSTDTTLDILKKYPHLIWLSELDKGQSDALNKGFNKAIGDWVLWLNADDVLLPKALAKFADKISKNLNADVIHGHVMFFLDKKTTIFRKQYFTKFNINKSIFGVVTHPSTGSLFSSKILKNNNLDIRFHYMMDAEWFLRCGKNLNLVIINDFLVKFRISDFNKTSDQIMTGKLNEQQEIEKKILYDFYVFPLLKKYPSILHNLLYETFRYYLLTINRLLKLRFYLRIT